MTTVKAWALHYHRCRRCGGFVPCQHSQPMLCSEAQRDMAQSCDQVSLSQAERHTAQASGVDLTRRGVLHLPDPGLVHSKGQNRNLKSIFGRALKRAQFAQQRPATETIEPPKLLENTPVRCVGLSAPLAEIRKGYLNAVFVDRATIVTSVEVVGVLPGNGEVEFVDTEGVFHHVHAPVLLCADTNRNHYIAKLWPGAKAEQGQVGSLIMSEEGWRWSSL